MTDIKFDYDNLLFRELRMVALRPIKEISNSSIVKAVTLNENLKSLGYCFSPDSFILLCQSDIDDLYDRIKSYVGEVKAEPMYRGFPREVMEMDEATFRFHQMLHYMSTYGVELFTGAKVSKGWLPESIPVNRDKEDTFKTDLKAIEAINSDLKYLLGASKMLSRKTRMTNSQVELVKEAIKHLDLAVINTFEIPFKENAGIIFYTGMDEKNLPLVKIACKNPTDAFKNISDYLTSNHNHFKTYQKRLAAKLLDSFDNYSFEENLIYSNSRREQVIRLLDRIDYPTYSRNIVHKASLNDLKDKRLKSWMSRIEKLIKAGDKEELFIAVKERPGMFLRMGIRLIRLGYIDEVRDGLMEVAPKLSTQTLIDIMNHYTFNKGDYESEIKVKEWELFTVILKMVLISKLSSISTELKNKKVYVDKQNYDLEHSLILKSEEGGYNRGGMAFKLPDTLNKVRFFVYWNDKNRVDVDLHANCFNKDGSTVNVGWRHSYKSDDNSVVFSGDITHSDAAEYIDIDLNKSNIRYVTANINLFSGKENFSEVDTCFAGLMGVEDVGQDVKLYDPKACFVSHELMSKTRTIQYGLIDLEHKYVRYIGQEPASTGVYQWNPSYSDEVVLSLDEYLRLLLLAQGVETVAKKEEADIILSIAKGGDISLIDKNFYVDF